MTVVVPDTDAKYEGPHLMAPLIVERSLLIARGSNLEHC